jgi:hypothetical protein
MPCSKRIKDDLYSTTVRRVPVVALEMTSARPDTPENPIYVRLRLAAFVLGLNRSRFPVTLVVLALITNP